MIAHDLDPEAESIPLVLLRIPVDLFRRSADYHEELLRECALLVVNEPSVVDDVPGSLLEVAEQLRAGYEPVPGLDEQMEAAGRRGEATVDVMFSLPRSVAKPLGRLEELFDSAEKYCVTGKLLTVAPPAEISAFRKWYLSEVSAQLAGFAPTPWHEEQPV